MDKDLRKRLEEAAKKSVSSDKMLSHEEGTGALIGFIWGAEYGYKEAIAQAKKWLRNNVSDYTATYIVGCSKGEFITYFGIDMNKLWEENK